MPQPNVVESEATVKQPEKMTVAELKTWIAQKGAPTKGKKKDLLDRYNYIIINVVF